MRTSILIAFVVTTFMALVAPAFAAGDGDTTPTGPVVLARQLMVTTDCFTWSQAFHPANRPADPYVSIPLTEEQRQELYGCAAMTYLMGRTVFNAKVFPEELFKALAILSRAGDTVRQLIHDHDELYIGQFADIQKEVATARAYTLVWIDQVCREDLPECDIDLRWYISTRERR